MYSYCLEDIFINYGDNKYELSSALSSGKITIDTLFEKEENQETDDKQNTLYRYKNYSIMKCNKDVSKDIIIAPRNIDISKVTCTMFENESES